MAKTNTRKVIFTIIKYRDVKFTSLTSQTEAQNISEQKDE